MFSSEPPKQGRYLVTSADERSWPFDRPVLFLGEWCRRHARRHVWQTLDAVVAAPYGLAPTTRDRDHVRARSYEAALFPHLYAILNRHHGTTYSERYWRILLGHWFRRYVEALLNRHQTLEVCLETYRPAAMTVFATDAFTMAPQDSYSAIRAFNDAHWNSRLYARLLGYVTTGNVAIEELSADPQHEIEVQTTVVSRNLQRRMRSWMVRQMRIASSYLARVGDALIVNSFLPRLTEVRLQLALGQFPQLLAGRTRNLPIVAIDNTLRRRLADELSAGKKADRASGVERALQAMLFELLPACYLEGYADLTAAADALPWPKSPHFIFTSNNFDTDEIFKAWTAAKTIAGVPYIVGQHGNNYGTARYLNPSIEEVTADRFITWGWTDGLTQHVPGFIFNTGTRLKRASAPQGGLLLIELHAGQMLTTWDAVAEFSDYFNEQLSFVECLRSSIRRHLKVRLHPSHIHLDWNEVERWQAFDPAVQLDLGSRHLGELMSKSRLVVHSYDSTGILETLAKNIPTVAFWQNGLTHLRDSAKPHYQRLVDVGILHLSPRTAATHINTIWDDVDAWWNSSAVQEARAKFCEQYARASANPVRDLKCLLVSCAVNV